MNPMTQVVLDLCPGCCHSGETPQDVFNRDVMFPRRDLRYIRWLLLDDLSAEGDTFITNVDTMPCDEGADLGVGSQTERTRSHHTRTLFWRHKVSWPSVSGCTLQRQAIPDKGRMISLGSGPWAGRRGGDGTRRGYQAVGSPPDTGQTLSDGNIGHPAAPGTGVPARAGPLSTVTVAVRAAATHRARAADEATGVLRPERQDHRVRIPMSSASRPPALNRPRSRPIAGNRRSAGPRRPPGRGPPGTEGPNSEPVGMFGSSGTEVLEPRCRQPGADMSGVALSTGGTATTLGRLPGREPAGTRRSPPVRHQLIETR